MTALSIPPPVQPLTNNDKITEPWYPVFLEIQRLRTDLDNLGRLTRGMGAFDSSVTGSVTFVGST